MNVRVSAAACAVTATVLLTWGLLRAPDALINAQAGEGISVGGAMQGKGSTASPLGLIGGAGASGRRFLGLGAGSAAFGWLTATHDYTLTGTGSAGSALGLATGLTSGVGIGLFNFMPTDGACYFDGTDTPAGATLSGTTYTLTRDVRCTTILVTSGIRVYTANWRVAASVEVWIIGQIDNNGRDATASAAGAAQAAGFFEATRAGAAQGTQLGVGTSLPPWYLTRSNGVAPAAPYGNGGNGLVAGQGGGGGASLGSPGTYVPGNTPLAASQGGPTLWTLWRGMGDANNASTRFFTGQGGSGGALVSANGGGFGGAAGGIVWIAAPNIYGSGTISANGGNGSSRAPGFNGGGGGGGAGGMLILFYNTRGAGLTLSVAGGAGGLGESGGASGGNGGAGATGTQYLMNMSGDGT